MVPRPGDRFPFATLPDDRKWYPLFSDPWLAKVTDAEAAIVASECEPLASELGYDWPRRPSKGTARSQAISALSKP